MILNQKRHSMRQLLSLILMSAFVSVANANVNVTVVDETDNSPIIGATVIDKAGIIIGITNNDGQISVANVKSMPLTIHCISYEPITSSATDTIKLSSSSFQLNEVVVNPKDRPIKRVICYAREYSTGIVDSDTLIYYGEHMLEAFLTEGKVNGYRKRDANPNTKGSRRYGRIAKVGSDSICKPGEYDDITMVSWVYFDEMIPNKRIEATKKITTGAETDTIYGKYRPKYIYKKKNNIFLMKTDDLCDNKDKIWSPLLFKMFGFTIDVDDITCTKTFADNNSKSYWIHDLTSSALNIHLFGRGKWLKKFFSTKNPIEFNSYCELYPVEITNCTVQEYKEMRKDRSELPFKYPEGLQPLSPAVQELVDRIEAL